MDNVAALIFDCDGTLADTMPAHYRAWIEVLTPYGLVFPEERFYSLGGMPSHRIVELLCAEQGVRVDYAHIAREKEARFVAQLDQIQPITAVVDIARDQRHRLPLAVASGGFRTIITRILSQLGIGSWFQTVVTAEDTERHKPDPDVFLEAARRLNVLPHRCVVYEDTDLGMEAARRAGMRGVDVRRLRARSVAAGCQ